MNSANFVWCREIVTVKEYSQGYLLSYLYGNTTLRFFVWICTKWIMINNLWGIISCSFLSKFDPIFNSWIMGSMATFLERFFYFFYYIKLSFQRVFVNIKSLMTASSPRFYEYLLINRQSQTSIAYHLYLLT